VHSVEHRRTFCFVTDAVEFTARAGFSPACEGEVLNVGVGEPEVRIGDLADRILRVLGRDLQTVSAPTTPGSPARRQPDMTRTVKLTGYQPQVSLDEGLAKTAAWYLHHRLTDA
jgi:nucleoside-diphosphate-sugar epimerase